MSAMIQIHAHIGISGLKNGEKHCHICLCSGMRLHVGILAAEKLFCTFSCKFFHHVYTLAAAVISLSRISFRVFVGQRASHSSHHGFAHPVFGCDQLDMGVLSLHLCFDRIGDFRVCCHDLIEVVHLHILHIIYFTLLH